MLLCTLLFSIFSFLILEMKLAFAVPPSKPTEYDEILAKNRVYGPVGWTVSPFATRDDIVEYLAPRIRTVLFFTAGELPLLEVVNRYQRRYHQLLPTPSGASVSDVVSWLPGFSISDHSDGQQVIWERLPGETAAFFPYTEPNIRSRTTPWNWSATPQDSVSPPDCHDNQYSRNTDSSDDEPEPRSPCPSMYNNGSAAERPYSTSFAPSSPIATHNSPGSSRHSLPVSRTASTILASLHSCRSSSPVMSTLFSPPSSPYSDSTGPSRQMASSSHSRTVYHIPIPPTGTFSQLQPPTSPSISTTPVRPPSLAEACHAAALALMAISQHYRTPPS